MSKHTVTLNVYYDYQNYITDTYTLTPLSSGYETSSKPTLSNLYAGGNDGQYQYRIHLHKQKCEAIQFEIIDVPDAVTPGESFQLTNMTLEVAIKTGSFKTSEKKQA
jgi:hypothetical protein